LSCAAACASLDLFEKEHTWDNVKRICNQNKEFAEKIQDHPVLKNVRVAGTILALEIETGEGNTYFSSLRDKAYNYFLENGMLVRPCGNVIFINPPYCITDEQLKNVYKVFSSFLTILKVENSF
jgi:adenosylmethionine-8-amino-7-oxononanoate aminotransferase